jgi:hypothetical protein
MDLRFVDDLWRGIRNGRGARAPGEPARPSLARIEARAFRIYLARGAKDGRAAQDWEQAERELRGPATCRRGLALAPAARLGVVMPLAGIAATVVLRLLLPDGRSAVLAGLAIALAAGLVTAADTAFHTTAERCNGRQHRALMAELRLVRAWLGNTRPTGSVGRNAWSAAYDHAEAVESLLGRRSSLWISSNGYTSAWSEVHRAQEPLMLFADLENVVAWAVDDEQRLSGSDIPNADQLRESVRSCLGLLKPREGKPEATDDVRARAQLKEVRYAINSYRDGIWQKLVNAKNLLAIKVAAGWVTAYLLIAGIVLVGTSPARLSGAALYFLLGAVVGVASDMSQQSLAQSAEEDYGLARERLLATMLLAGVAAVIGVAFTAILGVSVLGSSLATTAASAGRAGPLAVSWQQIFDSHDNLLGAVAAAAFGFAPSRLFDLLRTDQADAVRKIQSSRSAGPT